MYLCNEVCASVLNNGISQVRSALFCTYFILTRCIYSRNAQNYIVLDSVNFPLEIGQHWILQDSWKICVCVCTHCISSIAHRVMSRSTLSSLSTISALTKSCTKHCKRIKSNVNWIECRTVNSNLFYPFLCWWIPVKIIGIMRPHKIMFNNYRTWVAKI